MFNIKIFFALILSILFHFFLLLTLIRFYYNISSKKNLISDNFEDKPVNLKLDNYLFELKPFLTIYSKDEENKNNKFYQSIQTENKLSLDYKNYQIYNFNKYKKQSSQTEISNIFDTKNKNNEPIESFIEKSFFLNY